MDKAYSTFWFIHLIAIYNKIYVDGERLKKQQK